MDGTLGGAAHKKKSQPKLENVDKIPAIVVDLGSNAPDPEEANLVTAKDFQESLSILQINIPIELKDLDGDLVNDELEIRTQSDLFKNGIVNKVAKLHEQKNQKDLLHKWHASLTGDNVRAQNSVKALLASTEKDNFVHLLEQVADALMNYQTNPTQ